MCVARFNLYLQSFLYALNSSNSGDWKQSLVTLFGFWSWYLYALGKHGNFSTAFASMLISHAIAGILHVQILLSHYGEPVYLEVTREDGLEYYLRSQLQSSINIYSANWFTDLFHGGLHMQIDHHLFPRVPRHNLVRVSEIVQPFCKKHNLPHRTMGFFEANARLYRALRKVHMTKAMLECKG
jgi:fatty acid desaturase